MAEASRPVAEGSRSVDDVRALARELHAELAAKPKRERGDARDEVHAFGRALYVAATGKPPFDGTLPEGLRAPILRCLQRDPARRYASVDEVAVALGIAEAAPLEARRRRSGARRAIAMLFVCAIVVAGGLIAWRKWGARAAPSETGAGTLPPGPSEATGTTPLPRAVVAVAPFSPPTDPARAWWGRAVPEVVALSLERSPHLAIRRDPDAARDPRRHGVAVVLSGAIETNERGFTVDVKLYDVGTGALRFAERVTPANERELLEAIRAVVAKLGRSIDRPAVATTWPTMDPEALRAYVEGVVAEERGAAAEPSYREAARRDPRFVAPLARLILAGVHDESLVFEARARATDGEAAMFALAEARAPGDRVAALERWIRDAPHDAPAAAALAIAYRSAGRPLDCLAVGQRALEQGASSGLRRDLVWCALEAGDGAAALSWATAHAPVDGELTLGDVHLVHGRFAAARDAYRRAVERGSAIATVRLGLVDLHARGRCRRGVAEAARKVAAPPRDVEESAIAWASIARACGDVASAAEAERWLRATHAASTRSIAADPAVPERTLPIHRHPFFDAPPLLAVALARADAGDAEEATLACEEILAAAPTYAPAHYCLGRAAEAGKDRKGAFRAYREFLDRWSDADDEHRFVRDARRRLSRVIRDTRAASGATPE